MYRFPFRPAMVLAALSAPVLAQTLPPTAEPPPKLATELPSPPLGDDASPADFLRAAERALVAGRTGESQQSMEMAQTRLLDRSVPLGTTGIPSDQPAIKLISEGLQALSAGDRETCLQKIQAAREAAERNWKP